MYTLKTYAYYFHKPKVGDIVVLKDPMTKTYSVKRVVATEHQLVSISSNNIYVNGKLLDEWYLPAQTNWYAPSVNQCQKDECFVMGDNRNNSVDSREYGPISIRAIKGKIQL
jgi:signal peptidase I